MTCISHKKCDGHVIYTLLFEASFFHILRSYFKDIKKKHDHKLVCDVTIILLNYPLVVTS